MGHHAGLMQCWGANLGFCAPRQALYQASLILSPRSSYSVPTTSCISAFLTLPPLTVVTKLSGCDLSKVTKATERYLNPAFHSYIQASLMSQVCVWRGWGGGGR